MREATTKVVGVNRLWSWRRYLEKRFHRERLAIRISGRLLLTARHLRLVRAVSLRGFGNVVALPAWWRLHFGF